MGNLISDPRSVTIGRKHRAAREGGEKEGRGEDSS